MTDLTLEEVREIAPEQDLLAKLRDDAHLIWGTHKVSHEPARERKSKKKGRLPVWASGFLRLPRLFSWGAPENKTTCHSLNKQGGKRYEMPCVRKFSDTGCPRSAFQGEPFRYDHSEGSAIDEVQRVRRICTGGDGHVKSA